MQMHTAIDIEGHPCKVRAFVRSQEENTFHDIIDCSDTAHQCSLCQLSLAFLCEQPSCDIRIDHRRRNTIDANAMRGQFTGDGFCKAHNPSFSSTVVRRAKHTTSALTRDG